MATAQEILDLRAMINQPENTAPWTDEYLSGLIDAGTSLHSVAGQIWTNKASTYATLVDVQEGSSKRSLGNLQSNALKMASHYATLAGEDTGGGKTFRAARTRPIVRP